MKSLHTVLARLPRVSQYHLPGVRLLSKLATTESPGAMTTPPVKDSVVSRLRQAVNPRAEEARKPVAPVWFRQTVNRMVEDAEIAQDRQMVEKAFDTIVSEIDLHPASNHGLFIHMAELAEKGTLTAKQVDQYLHGMYARIAPTVRNLCILGKKGVEESKYSWFRTAAHNIWEESGEGKHKTHPELLMDAFNEIAALYHLKPSTLKEAAENPRLEEEVIYDKTVRGLYEGPYAEVISFAQERASGGDNTENHRGMVGAMLLMCDALKLKLPRRAYEEYFAAHIEMGPDGKQVFKGNGVEYQHNVRAREIAVESLQDKWQQAVKTKLAPAKVEFLSARKAGKTDRKSLQKAWSAVVAQVNTTELTAVMDAAKVQVRAYLKVQDGLLTAIQEKVQELEPKQSKEATPEPVEQSPKTALAPFQERYSASKVSRMR